ncbi:hypothetical protein [Antarcticimicrobium luteum]|uniref:Sulfotransferase family protein n=1 Tax=Antarcticimicrobium luteum TaxID=2547397 RepID=A0A4R5VG85_9RHOB|nr:hypothetical protein [Antarcticimicrobium luteum]TDK50892.1 hypothetical protein E1832_04945 [Antarcticimicrobium luteum]
MTRRLILHIGAHRTATSALQAFLFENFQPLKQKGFFYPLKVRRHLKLMNQIFNGTRKVENVARILTERADKQPQDIHTLILSDEDICMRRDLGVLAKFRDSFDVKVVFTLRRQDIWLESWFFQNIKWQWNEKLSHCTFDEFMDMRGDFHWIHYDRYVRHLEGLFGRDNIILNIHEKGQMPDGPIEAFCDRIGLTDRTGFAPAAHINESFSPQISEFMRRLPLDAAETGYRGRLTAVCAKIDRALTGGSKQSERLMPHDQRTALMAEYEAGNRAIAQRYFDRDTLFSDPLPGPDAPLARMALPADSDRLMTDYIVPLIAGIIADHEKQKEKEKARAAQAK